MAGWETTIFTGNADADRATVEQHRQAATAQGLTFEVQPLPTGGFQVRASATPSGHAPQGFGQPQGNAQQGYAPQGYAPQGYAPHGNTQQGYGPQGNAPQGYGHAHAHAPQGNAQQGYAQPQAQPSYQAQAYGAPQGGWQPEAAAAGYASAPVSGYASGPAGGFVVGGEAASAPALGRERVAYLRKVYGLLSLSALVAIGCGLLAITVGPTTMFRTDDGHKIAVPMICAILLGNHVAMYAAFGLLFVATLGASAVSKVRGVNLVALLGVSALMGIELAPMVFVAQVFAGLGQTLSLNPVRDTFLMVGGIFAGITGYVFVTRKDFSYLKATLNMGFWVVFLGCFLAVFFQSDVFSLAIASVGALVAAGFLLVQTSRIFRDSKMDDAVGDCLVLLVQLRNLFVFLLRILMSSRR